MFYKMTDSGEIIKHGIALKCFLPALRGSPGMTYHEFCQTLRRAVMKEPTCPHARYIKCLRLKIF